MTPDPTPLDELRVADSEHWEDGPPLQVFARLRSECPVHWSPGMSEFPEEPGFWSVTTSEHVHEVSRDWQTYSSERGGMLMGPHSVFPLELQNAMFIGMDPPKHDRIKALFQRGFTPRRIAGHEEEIRRVVTGVLDGVADRERIDLVEDVAQPAVARVIGGFMGIAPEQDAMWARVINAVVAADDPDLNPDGPQTVVERDIPFIFAHCAELIAERRERPTDDLLTVLMDAEVDGERLTDPEIVMGFLLLMTAGNDSTKATYCSAMRALMEDEEQRAQLLEDPSRIPDAVEEALRMFPAFAHFRRTATTDAELGGQTIREGDKVVLWYPSTGRDAARYEDPDRFDVARRPEHQAFGAGGRHYCLGTALARLELRILLEETLVRFPRMRIVGEPRHARARFLNQLTTLPVALAG